VPELGSTCAGRYHAWSAHTGNRSFSRLDGRSTGLRLLIKRH